MSRSTTVYDVWLTATNRAYRGVPFSTVTDWLEQGRILPTDKIRPDSGDWIVVAESPLFVAFLPRSAGPEVDDAADALEPVSAALPIRRRPGDDDDDVDMIPLIDISLVLLIFFMMTATVAVGGARVETPLTRFGVELSQDKSMLWIGVDRRDEGQPVYSIGKGDQQADSGDSELTLEQVLRKLDERLKASPGGTVVRIAGHKRLPFGTMIKLTAELESRRRPSGIIEIKAEVNERSS